MDTGHKREQLLI
jgi:hypothetical protein